MELYITAFLILTLFAILGSGVWIGLSIAAVLLPSVPVEGSC